jgi:adenylyltransferase/sulfurtransferase
MNILPGETACLACMFPESPRGTLETCETAGVLGPAVSVVASAAAGEALKLLVGAREQLRLTLLSWDIWSNQTSAIQAGQPHPNCRACGRRDFVHLAGEGRAHITLCGRNSVQIHERARPMNFALMSERLRAHGTVRHNEFVLKFWHDPYELTLFPDGRAIIKGTSDTAVARSLYARYIGS